MDEALRVSCRAAANQCVDRRLARELPGHEVTTVPQRGWAGVKNGELLALAEKEFDAFVTVDRKISVQQDLTCFQIAVMLLRAPTNRLKHIRPLAPALLEKIQHAPVGALTVIGS